MTELISFAIFVLILITGTIGQQPDPKSEGIIAGRVTVDGEAVAGVEITLQPAPEPMRLPLPDPIAKVITDKEGRFRLSNVAPGRYYLTVLTSEYILPSPVDSHIPQSLLVILAKGEQINEINVLLKRGGAISGQVRTADGEAAARWNVFIDQVEINDRTPGHTVNRVRRYISVTDENGKYRVEGLPVGTFLLCVDEGRDVHPSRWIFYPGVREQVDAGAIKVLPGQTTADIDIVLPRPPHTYEVHGHVINDTTGEPVPNVRVDWRTPASANQNSYLRGGHRTNDLGEFHFKGILPGRYEALISVANGSEFISDPRIFEIPGLNADGLEIRARKGGSLSGKIAVEGGTESTPPDFLSLIIRCGPSTGGMGTMVQPSADGHFRIEGLPTGKYQLDIQTIKGPKRYSLLRIERNGADLKNGVDAIAGEPITDLKIIVAYGTGIVRGEVQIVNGPLPANAQMSVSAHRADVPGRALSANFGSVDARRRFVIDGLGSGEHEIQFFVFVPPSIVPEVTILQRKTITQKVIVKSGTESHITIVFDAATLEKK